MHVGGDQVHAVCSRALFSCPACTMMLVLPDIARELSRPAFGPPKTLPLQARSLGMWSSAVQLVNAREQARARREQALREGADEPAMPPTVAWTPSRDVNLGPRWGQGCQLVIHEGAGQGGSTCAAQRTGSASPLLHAVTIRIRSGAHGVAPVSMPEPPRVPLVLQATGRNAVAI